jgi:hypothetical protein
MTATVGGGLRAAPDHAVVVPWRAGCSWRDRAWQWVRPQYEAALPGWEIVEATLPDDQPWSTSRALMENLAGDIVVMSGADCWSPGLAEAVAAVEAGAVWAMPHTLVHRLTLSASKRVYGGATFDSLTEDHWLEKPYKGIKGDGICVVRRETFEEIPQDIRFTGWGRHGRAWRDAMTTFHGDPWRGSAPLYHLWHPPQERPSRMGTSAANEQLYARYKAARGDKPAMRVLIEEARACLSRS